jgi:hypothetical protein
LNSKKNTILEQTGLHLLNNGCPVLLGMPAYGVANCVFRKVSPATPADIMGVGERTSSSSVLEDYQQLLGYHFPWGTVSEHSFEGDDTGVRFVDFTFDPRDVYLAFPDGWHLADLFHWLYQSHPLCHRKFETDPDSVIFDWSVISFQARGERQIKALRSWLVEVFIPLIWPDLLREAMRLIEQKKASIFSTDGSFEELLSDRSRWLLCSDPAELTYYTGE